MVYLLKKLKLAYCIICCLAMPFLSLAQAWQFYQLKMPCPKEYICENSDDHYSYKVMHLSTSHLYLEVEIDGFSSVLYKYDLSDLNKKPLHVELRKNDIYLFASCMWVNGDGDGYVLLNAPDTGRTVIYSINSQLALKKVKEFKKDASLYKAIDSGFYVQVNDKLYLFSADGNKEFNIHKSFYTDILSANGKHAANLEDGFLHLWNEKGISNQIECPKGIKNSCIDHITNEGTVVFLCPENKQDCYVNYLRKYKGYSAKKGFFNIGCGRIQERLRKKISSYKLSNIRINYAPSWKKLNIGDFGIISRYDCEKNAFVVITQIPRELVEKNHSDFETINLISNHNDSVCGPRYFLKYYYFNGKDWKNVEKDFKENGLDRGVFSSENDINFCLSGKTPYVYKFSKDNRLLSIGIEENN